MPQHAGITSRRANTNDHEQRGGQSALGQTRSATRLHKKRSPYATQLNSPDMDMTSWGQTKMHDSWFIRPPSGLPRRRRHTALSGIKSRKHSIHSSPSESQNSAVFGRVSMTSDYWQDDKGRLTVKDLVRCTRGYYWIDLHIC